MPTGDNLRRIDLNGSAGALTDIFASRHCRYAEIVETDDANAGNPQGLQGTVMTDANVATQKYNPGSTITLGNDVAKSGGVGDMIGMPQHGSVGEPGYRAADKLASLKSLTATATTVWVREFC